mgnify:CR=1 FL=1
MLVTKRLETKVEQLSLEDMDFDQVRRDYELDLAMEMAEINFIQTDADKLAIEVYVDYNGNETMLESYYVTLTENAVSDTANRIRNMLERLAAFIMEYLRKFANWVKGLFDKNQAFINKYGNNPTKVNMVYIDFEKAERNIQEYIDDYNTFYNKTINNPIALGGALAAMLNNKRTDVFDFLINNYAGLKKDYEKNGFANAIKAEILGDKNKSNTSIGLNRFCKELKSFMNLSKQINNLADVKIQNKANTFAKTIAEKVFGEDSTFTIGISTSTACTTFLTNLLSVITQVYRDVLVANMQAVHKALANTDTDIKNA